MELSNILIVGAGQAGACAAATLRREGFAGRITLAGAEPHRPYERPPLSKAVLSDARAEEGIFLHRQALHDELDLVWRPGLTVDAIDPAAGLATTADGERLAFDRCLIATGGRARPLPDLPVGSSNVYYLRGLDDARALRGRLRAGASVVVVGGGFLGLEFAGVARASGLAVTVLESADEILGRSAPALLGSWLRGRHEQAGVRIVRNARVRAVVPDPAQVSVTLDDGQVLCADFLLVSIGQLPNIALAERAKLRIDNGIAVDAHCASSAPGVFAAGDCASHLNRFLGARVRLESWQNAQEQAAVAARAMLGQPAEYDVVPWFWSDQLGMNIQMVGVPGAGYRYVVRGDPDTARFAILGFDQNVVRYALTVNSGGDMRPLRNLVTARTEMDSTTLTDTTRSLRDIAKAVIGHAVTI
jgi:3-phenylpropionate/trans-cinnamate dioxygenase ferredoxin reductase subunit